MAAGNYSDLLYFENGRQVFHVLHAWKRTRPVGFSTDDRCYNATVKSLGGSCHFIGVGDVSKKHFTIRAAEQRILNERVSSYAHL